MTPDEAQLIDDLCKNVNIHKWTQQNEFAYALDGQSDTVLRLSRFEDHDNDDVIFELKYLKKDKPMWSISHIRTANIHNKLLDLWRLVIIKLHLDKKDNTIKEIRHEFLLDKINQ